MNKEEIEDIKDNLRTLHKVLWNENREGTYTTQRILEYINCLERKESILDKVTDKLKEDIAISEKGKDTNIILTKEYYKNKQEYAQEILNSIEGDKQNGNV